MGQHNSSFIIHLSSFIHTIRNTIYDNNSDCKSDLWTRSIYIRELGFCSCKISALLTSIPDRLTDEPTD